MRIKKEERVMYTSQTSKRLAYIAEPGFISFNNSLLAQPKIKICWQIKKKLQYKVFKFLSGSLFL